MHQPVEGDWLQRQLERAERDVAAWPEWKRAEAGLPVLKVPKTGDIMVRLPGSTKTFHCDCGCNVFRYINMRRHLKCNGCEAIYAVEK